MAKYVTNVSAINNLRALNLNGISYKHRIVLVIWSNLPTRRSLTFNFYILQLPNLPSWSKVGTIGCFTTPTLDSVVQSAFACWKHKIVPDHLLRVISSWKKPVGNWPLRLIYRMDGRRAFVINAFQTANPLVFLSFGP